MLSCLTLLGALAIGLGRTPPPVGGNDLVAMGVMLILVGVGGKIAFFRSERRRLKEAERQSRRFQRKFL